MALMLKAIKAKEVKVTRFTKGKANNSSPSRGRIYNNAQVAYEEFGDPHDVIRMFEYEIDMTTNKLKHNEVLIQVEAATVTQTDCLLRKGVYTKGHFPCTPGTDLVGLVVECGKNAEAQGFKRDAYVAAFGASLGSNAKFVVASSERLAIIPEKTRPDKAVCVVSNYVAAYQCLYRLGHRPVETGSKVLLTDGHELLGQAVIELSKLADAGKIYAVSPKEQHDFVKSLGAIPIENLEGRIWEREIKGKMDIVIDSSCRDRYEKTRESVKDKTGRLVCTGTTSSGDGNGPTFFGKPILSHWNRITAEAFMSQTYYYDVFESMEYSPVEFKRDLIYLLKMLRDGLVAPSIASTVSLREIPSAHESVERRHYSGYTVCVPFQPPEETIVPGEHMSRIGKAPLAGTMEEEKTADETLPTVDDSHMKMTVDGNIEIEGSLSGFEIQFSDNDGLSLSPTNENRQEGPEENRVENQGRGMELYTGSASPRTLTDMKRTRLWSESQKQTIPLTNEKEVGSIEVVASDENLQKDVPTTLFKMTTKISGYDHGTYWLSEDAKYTEDEVEIKGA